MCSGLNTVAYLLASWLTCSTAQLGHSCSAAADRWVLGRSAHHDEEESEGTFEGATRSAGFEKTKDGGTPPCLTCPLTGHLFCRTPAAMSSMSPKWVLCLCRRDLACPWNRFNRNRVKTRRCKNKKRSPWVPCLMMWSGLSWCDGPGSRVAVMVKARRAPLRCDQLLSAWSADKVRLGCNMQTDQSLLKCCAPAPALLGCWVVAHGLDA